MQWLRDLWSWLAGGEPTADPPPSEAGDGDGDVRYARQATWEDVFTLVALLERHRVEYALVGGYALSFNGVVRQTGDVDILVRDTAQNNRRWLAALCELPAGAAKELLTDGEFAFVTDDDPGDDEPGAVRVVDEFVVDVLPSACGLTFEDLQPYIKRRPLDGFSINVLDLAGLRLTKQGMRDKDRADLALVESALRVLGEDLGGHASVMSRRRFAEEPAPRPDVTEFRMPGDDDGIARGLAESVLARAELAGAAVDVDVDTLALYADEGTLLALLGEPDAVTDIRARLTELGVTLPQPGR